MSVKLNDSAASNLAKYFWDMCGHTNTFSRYDWIYFLRNELACESIDSKTKKWIWHSPCGLLGEGAVSFSSVILIFFVGLDSAFDWSRCRFSSSKDMGLGFSGRNWSSSGLDGRDVFCFLHWRGSPSTSMFHTIGVGKSLWKKIIFRFSVKEVTTELTSASDNRTCDIKGHDAVSSPHTE